MGILKDKLTKARFTDIDIDGHTVKIKVTSIERALELSDLDDKESGYHMIYECVYDEDERRVFDSPSEAKQVNADYSMQLLSAINRVNGYEEDSEETPLAS